MHLCKYSSLAQSPNTSKIYCRHLSGAVQNTAQGCLAASITRMCCEHSVSSRLLNATLRIHKSLILTQEKFWTVNTISMPPCCHRNKCAHLPARIKLCSQRKPRHALPSFFCYAAHILPLFHLLSYRTVRKSPSPVYMQLLESYQS